MNEHKSESLPRASAIVAAVVWFLGPLILAFIVPKFENIFTSVLGAKAPLWWLTEFVIETPVWVHFAEATVIPAALLGKEWLVDDKLGSAIDRAAVIFAIIYVGGSLLAVFMQVLELQSSLSKK